MNQNLSALFGALQKIRPPEYRSDVTAWHGHLPFASFILSASKPTVFLELGTHKGDSYCAFCQAVETAGLHTRCFAVDSWQGDEHAGVYPESVYHELKLYHDPKYGRFSTLMRLMFDEALEYFDDGSIDLVHIDGLHTYDAIKDDFLKWLPKLSRRAVVLLHDIHVRERGFGVWRYWGELKKQYPTFESPISNGLGLVAVGEEIPEGLAPLFYDSDIAASMSDLMSCLGALVMEVDAKDESVVPPVQEIYSNNTSDDKISMACELYTANSASGFREDTAQTFVINPSSTWSKVDCTFLIRNAGHALRIDPINSPAHIRDVQILVRVSDESQWREIDHRLMQFNGLVHRREDTLSLGDDPQIIIDGLVLQVNDEVRVRFSVRPLVEHELAELTEEWLNEISPETIRTALRDVGTQVDTLPSTIELVNMVLEKLRHFHLKVDEHKSEIKRVRADLFVESTKVQTLETMRDHAETIRIEIENKLAHAELQLEEVNAELDVARDELSTVLHTKGWRLLNVLRTIRSFAREPKLTARKLYASFKQLGFRTTVQRVSDKISRVSTEALSEVKYDGWQKANETRFLKRTMEIKHEIQSWDKHPVVSVIMPTYNSEVVWLQEAVASLLQQPYENWELVISDDHSPNSETVRALQELSRIDGRIRVIFSEENKGISGNANIALEAAQGDLITFLDHDDTLSPNAFYEVVREWNTQEFDVLYSDEDKLRDGVYEDAFFKPDYSPDYLLSCNYFNHLTVYRKSIVDRVGYLRREFDGAQDYDLLLRATEIADRIVHVPHVLYHWRKVPGSTAASFDSKSYAHDAGKRAIEEAIRRRGERGAVLDTGYPGHYRVDRDIHGNPLVSIIIPMRDKHEVLKTCLDSIRQSTYENVEILIIDNGSQEPDTLAYLSSLTDCRILRYDIPFNYSKLNNWATKEASGDYLIFLNNDIEVITPDWIEQMLQHAQRPNVGVVGAKLLYPDGKIQHAGVVLGIGGVADHAHKSLPRTSPGYFGTVIDIRNYSAVTAACMMVPKGVFEACQGFDEERLAVAFNDVDLCLRVRSLGYLCVYTPYAELWHYESLSRSSDMNYHEIFYMQNRWGGTLASDPYYNEHLSLRHHDFRFDAFREKSYGSNDLVNEVLSAYKEWLSLDKQSLNVPQSINILSQLYSVRPDLQVAFRESNGQIKFKELIYWAVDGEFENDSSSDLLAPYSEELAALVKSM